MKITAFVKTNAKTEIVEKIDEAKYKVAVKTRPDKGRANKRVIKLLANHLDIPKSSIRLVLGTKYNQKVFEID